MDRVYQDRRMLKWLPFDALPEQHGYLKAVYEAFEVITRPELLPDQIEYLNYRIEEAYHLQEEITLKVFEKGHFTYITGTILGLHPNDHFLLIGRHRVPFEDIVELS